MLSKVLLKLSQIIITSFCLFLFFSRASYIYCRMQ